MNSSRKYRFCLEHYENNVRTISTAVIVRLHMIRSRLTRQGIRRLPGRLVSVKAAIAAAVAVVFKYKANITN